VRIGLVATTWRGEPSGVGRRLREIATRLASRGHEVVLLAARDPRPLLGRAGSDLQFQRAAVPARPIPLRAVGEVVLLRHAVAAARLDVVGTDHVPTPRFGDVPLLVTVHDLRYAMAFPGAPKLRRLVARAAYQSAVRAADVVVAVSNATAEEIERRLGIPRSRIRVVPNAADHLPLAAPTVRRSYLLYVGHLEPRKNLSTLLRALAHLERGPRLVLVGEGKRREQERLSRFALRLGLSDRIELRGAISDEDLPSLYAGALACVFPSWCEGFDIPLLEAMRCGTAVLASSIPPHREVGGDAALYFDPQDAPGLARRIDEVLENAPLRTRLEAAGGTQAAKYSWDATVGGFLEACAAARA
jgi:glycosyltransferase involved in cell wall biosynthesis